MSTLRKDEDDGPVIIGDVGFAAGGIRPDVSAICLVECLQRIFGRMTIVFLGFVVHQAYVKLFFTRDALKNGVAIVLKGPALAIPIHGKCVDAHALCLLNLFAQDRRILR